MILIYVISEFSCSVFLYTVVLGYNGHDYNKFTVLRNKNNSTFLVPNDDSSAKAFTVITISPLYEQTQWSSRVCYNL